MSEFKHYEGQCPEGKGVACEIRCWFCSNRQGWEDIKKGNIRSTICTLAAKFIPDPNKREYDALDDTLRTFRKRRVAYGPDA